MQLPHRVQFQWSVFGIWVGVNGNLDGVFGNNLDGVFGILDGVNGIWDCVFAI